MDKKSQLLDLKKRMQDDVKLPLRHGATQLVFGEGNANTDVYFLGEAPGYFEDKQGRPFVGLAGQLLDKLIESIGLVRKDVYISNVIRFRPPGNRDPEPDELGAFAPYVDEEIKIIEPKVIVTLGRFSMNKFLPDARISAVHGKKFVVEFNGKKQIVLPMYHPAAALRNGAIMNLLKEDFQIIKLALAGDIAESGAPKSGNNSQLSLV
ncbi:MAG: uracil-DNA glycosylase [Patescibacteria group bacterium]